MTFESHRYSGKRKVHIDSQNAILDCTLERWSNITSVFLSSSPAITLLRFAPIMQHHQRKSRSKNFTGTAINLEYQAYFQKKPVWILLIIILKQLTELRSIQSLCQQICSTCLAMISTRGMLCFSWKTSLKQASHDKNCVFMPQCMYLVLLVLELWSCFLKFGCRGGTGFGPEWFIYQYLCVSSA